MTRSALGVAARWNRRETLAPPKPEAAPLSLPQPGAFERLLQPRLERVASARRLSIVSDMPAGPLMPDRAPYAGPPDDPTGRLQWAARAAGADFLARPFVADAGLVDRLGLATCLARSLAPVARVGGAAVLATSRPEDAMRHARLIRARLGQFRLVFAPAPLIESALLTCRGAQAVMRAHQNIPAAEGCVGWQRRRSPVLAILGAATLALLILLAPLLVLALVTLWAVVMMAAQTCLKLAGIWLRLRGPTSRPLLPERLPLPARRPFVSILVPLLHEEEIASRLVRRLSMLDYPKERLEICLILEQDDSQTRRALAAAQLPDWMRVVEVPAGPVQTKPRALNYALAMCRGEIIGVLDAEDAPEPDQIERAVAGFADAPPDVVCLQGALDYYNCRETLLTRLFTLEYAALFRLMLPSIERLGLVIPLGGTTLYFRRRALEAIGGWDAWNVTEDADLGLRLVRHGWRTAMLASATHEEATSRVIPWIRQRSRWLKGYALTWATHMRQPRRLWRELGPWRFLGVQVMYLGSVTQILLAPVLWSFWLLLLGFGHPLQPLLGPVGVWGLVALFLLCEVTNVTAAALAISSTRHRGLVRYALLLHLYGWLATAAAWKAAFELVVAPFYWDKTSHGRRHPIEAEPR